MAARLTASFPPPICERLRKLRVRYENAISKKADATSGRDEMVEEINKCKESEKSKLSKLKEAHSDYCREITTQGRISKAALSALMDTIEKGDDLKLWENDVDTNPTPKSLLKESKADDKPDEDEKKPEDGAAPKDSAPAA